MIPLFWHQSTNFGDALAPWLVKKISGEEPTYVSPQEGQPFLVTGSIFGHTLRSGIVWGAGCAFEAEVDPQKMAPPGGALKVIATRGELSQKYLQQAGYAPECGDPGYLLPYFYTPRPSPKVDVAIMCSWVDLDLVAERFPGVPVISSMDPIESVIDRICACTLLLSSSMHGLVAAAAYGVATRRVSFSDRMIGDGFKYRDAGFSEEVRLVGGENLSTMLPSPVSLPDTKALLDCCPFRKGI